MIYTCQHCGAWFPSESIRAAVKNNETIITCNHCGGYTEFRQIQSSHISKGYDHLCVGDFYLATVEFNLAIDDAVARGKQPSPDVYFGYALAQFRVQTIFSDDDPNRLEVPTLFCQKCNEMDFADSTYYRKALQALQDSADRTHYVDELNKFEASQQTIDNIKDYYKTIERSKPDKFEYGLFIAYEEMPALGSENRGFEIAHKVRNALPSEIRDIFLPDIDDYAGDKERYEAAILYALDHSKCMLVITDDNVDSRLNRLYSQYYLNEYNTHKVREPGKNLGFVRYCGHITITLPDKTYAEKNVFDLEDKSGYVQFVCLHNNIIIRTKEDVLVEPPTTIIKEPINLTGEGATESSEHPIAYQILPGGQFAFGHYPQKQDASKEVEEFFAQFSKPTISNANGWRILFYSKKGIPYTWYRDEEYKGKKYRGVYFLKYRETYSVQASDATGANLQKAHGYKPLRVYCFAFEPLIWDVEDMSADSVVLVANKGVDAREYNNADLDGDWNHSSIKEWLNHEFIDDAFIEEERNYLCAIGGDSPDKIFLMDRKYDQSYYGNRHNIILGSDYYKCLGGMGDRGINSCWIIDQNNHASGEASVLCPDWHYSITNAYVDSTMVAVLPKIILKLK